MIFYFDLLPIFKIRPSDYEIADMVKFYDSSKSRIPKYKYINES